MGRSSRPKPARMASKLLRIREALNISQAEMVKRLDNPKVYPAHVSGFERGDREPSLPVLLRYARVAGICVEVLIDDELQLPERLPARPRHAALQK